MRSLLLLALAASAAWFVAGLLPATTMQPQPPAAVGASEVGWNRIDVPAARDGHFLLTMQVDGIPVTFMVDSGASTVVLAPQDARRLGWSAARLVFSQRFATANGDVRAAPVVLREVRVGQFARYGVTASVNEAAMGMSLLGMSFLRQLEAWEIRGDTLRLLLVTRVVRVDSARAVHDKGCRDTLRAGLS